MGLCKRVVQKSNRIDLYTDHAVLHVVSGKYGNLEFLIDLDDVELCRKYIWSAYYQGEKRMYASTNIEQQSYALHRVILGTHHPQGGTANGVVDHINRNTFDNRRANLRFTTNAVNARNTDSFRNGVVFDKRYGSYRAAIKIQNIKYNLGSFSSKEEAEVAYQNAVNTPDQVRGFQRKVDLPTGVSLTSSKKYKARIGFDNRRIDLGSFDTIEEAEQAYKKPRERFYGVSP